MGKPSRATVSQNVPAGEDTNTSSSPKKAKPTTRATTVLSKVTRHRAKNLKFKVKWNRNGEAIGPYCANFKSYVGMSTRHRVNITYETWKDVPDHIKDAIYIDVSGKSEKNRKATLENDFKYRASRKGYPGVEEEKILDAAKELSDFEDALPVITPPRDKVWLRARQDKDGNMDESVQQVATQMELHESNGEKGKDKCVNLDALSESSNTTNKDCPKKDQSHEIELTKEQHSKLSTPTLQMMYKLARTIGTVSIPAHKNLMMEANFLWITKEEIFQWIFQEQIQATHVSIYLGNLLDTYPDKNRLSQFKFLCPHKIAEIPLVIPSKQQAVLIAEK